MTECADRFAEAIDPLRGPSPSAGLGMTSRAALIYFFGFSAGLPASFAKALTRSNSFWNPLVKSWVPYSKRTTKQKVKKTKRTSQKSPRRSDMGVMVTYWCLQVNGARRMPNFRFEPKN
jgi:hypothetical protein